MHIHILRSKSLSWTPLYYIPSTYRVHRTFTFGFTTFYTVLSIEIHLFLCLWHFLCQLSTKHLIRHELSNVTKFLYKHFYHYKSCNFCLRHSKASVWWDFFIENNRHQKKMDSCELGWFYSIQRRSGKVFRNAVYTWITLRCIKSVFKLLDKWHTIYICGTKYQNLVFITYSKPIIFDSYWSMKPSFIDNYNYCHGQLSCNKQLYVCTFQ